MGGGGRAVGRAACRECQVGRAPAEENADKTHVDHGPVCVRTLVETAHCSGRGVFSALRAEGAPGMT